jgi:ribosome-associated heat shock protein Hsp15
VSEPLASVRLDRWLWAARFYTARPLAVAAIDGGKVQVNGDRVKRSKFIKPGDQVRIRQNPYEYLVEVTELADKRGSAKVAATLYQESAESLEAREKLAFQMKHAEPTLFQTKGRPSKKQRRDIRKWKKGDDG